PNQSRSLRDGDSAEIAPCRAGLVHRPLDDAADVADVLARCELGHHASPFAMNLHLRRDDIRANRPRPGQVARFLDDGRRGFVAGGFDPENSHHENYAPTPAGASKARLSVSRYGARKMPRSVM